MYTRVLFYYYYYCSGTEYCNKKEKLRYFTLVSEYDSKLDERYE